MVIETMTSDLTSPTKHVSVTETSGLTRLVHDLITLAELQVKMLKLDAAKSAKLFIAGMVFLALSICLGLAGTIVLAIAASHGLIVSLQWDPWTAYGAVGLVSVLLALFTTVVFYNLAKSASSAFKNSADELKRNLEAIKNSIVSS